MQTLSKGYFKPENPDTGDVVFPALEANWERVNDHNHDGVNSQYLAAIIQTITGAWTAVANGTYSKTITMPVGITYDACQMQFRLATGEVVYPSITRVTSSSYTIFTNNPQDYVAIYR